MKRIVCLILSLSLLLSLCACGSGDTPPEQSSPAPESSAPVEQESPAPASSAPVETDEPANEGIDVDSGLFNVTLTIPASFLAEGTTQEQLTEEARENGYKSITLNEDGSATYVMSKAKHQEMVDEIKQSIDESLDEMVSSESYPNIVSVTTNSDYSQYIVTLNTDEVSMETAFLPMAFYLFSGMYHAFNGTQVENVNIQFVNEAGELLEESNSNDMQDTAS